MGHRKSSAQREIRSNTGLPPKEEKSQIDNLTQHLNELEKEQTKPKVSRRKEIIKIREEINKLEIQKTIEKKSEYTFFSSTHGTFSRIDYILGHKPNLNKFKSVEIISSIFSDHNGMKL